MLSGGVDALFAGGSGDSGLLISSTLKSQFVASQVTLLGDVSSGGDAFGISFRFAQPAGRGADSYLSLPARYYVTLLQTIFLVGDIWAVILPNAAVLAAMMTALLLFGATSDAEKLWREADHDRYVFCAFSRLRAKELLAILKDPRTPLQPRSCRRSFSVSSTVTWPPTI